MQTLDEIFGCKIPKDPRIVYLGLIPEGIIHTKDVYLFKILTLASKKTITRNWLKSDPPTLTNWLDLVEEILSMEKLTHYLRNKAKSYHQRWEKWTVFQKRTMDYTSHNM